MKILIVSPISQDAIAALRHDHEVVCAINADEEEICRQIVGCDTLIFRSGPTISANVLRCSPGLSLILRAGSGLDNLDVDYVRENGIALHRIERPGARAVAELSFALMLTLARQIQIADQTVRQGRWAKHEITGYLLQGKTLGIVGAGNIGATAGAMGAAWGMEVIGCVEQPTAERARALAESQIRLVAFEEVIETADFVSLHVPLQDSTRHLLARAEFQRMKSSSFLINVARGGVVNELDLHEALRQGQIAGAGLDVHEIEGEGMDSPLAGLGNVVLTPHMGSGTVDTQRLIGDEILEIIAAHCQEHEPGAAG